MFLFKKDASTLNEIKEKPFKLEKELQEITEKNLEKIFWLEFVCTEFSVGEFRIDTFAYDPENKSFIIIEYKRDKSFSVVDQWYSYLALLLNNKAEFVLKYNEVFKKPIQKSDISWESSRVIFVANSFTPHQKNAINFKDLPIELRESRQFEKEIILFNQIKASKTSESVKTISKWDKNISKITEEIRTYTIDDHIKKWWDDSRELYEKISEKILSLDSRIEEKIVRPYVWYKIWNKVFVSIHIYKSKIDLELLRFEPKDFKDPENKVSYQKNSMEFYNKHVSVYSINNEDDIDYGIMLAKQVLKKFF
jgi:predicted transport protein